MDQRLGRMGYGMIAKTLITGILCLVWSALADKGAELLQPAAASRSPATVTPSCVRIEPFKYPDGRPAAKWRLPAHDTGRVYRHGSGPGKCDYLGARDLWVYEHRGVYHLNYDGAGPDGWLACLATSTNLADWTPHGPVLDFGPPGSEDSASASYGTTFFDGRKWHMFYLGTPHVTPAPDFIPAFPYLTMKAIGNSPAGPWHKQREVIPFRPKPGSYYSDTASPGQIIRRGGEFLMFFSASTDRPILRTISIARTKDLNGPWTINPAPIVPSEEQIENTSLYFERANRTWFLFTNHIGVENGAEFTDAVWVYWSKDLSRWDAHNKAVVLDGSNCTWSRKCIGLPGVVQAGKRLAILYDASGGDSISHMKRDLGLAWLELPLVPPP